MERARMHRRRRLDALRQRCLSRVREERERRLGARRGMKLQPEQPLTLHHIVRAELQAVATRERRVPSAVWTEDDEAELQDSLGADAYLELMTSTEIELLSELQAGMSSSLGLADEYELYVQQEEAFLAMNAESAVRYNEDAVPCPLCMRGTLQLVANGVMIICSRNSAAAESDCTFKLNSQGHPAPIELLRERMCFLLSEHSRCCQGFAGCKM
ncbi:MAG: hypothetical protein SGPRY_012603, partial [Prymnesium sp.]